MKKSVVRIYLPLIVCVLLTLTAVAFIFSNSLQNMEESGHTSGAVVEVIKPPLDPQDRIPLDVFSHYVRKAAHFVEFFWLGMALFGVAYQLRRTPCPRITHFPVCGALLTALMVAVADEFLQSFTGRGSAVADVLLDFGGALCGFAATAAVTVLVRCICAKRAASGSEAP